MSADVQAVMKVAAKRLRLGVEGPLTADQLDEARAAVAELIEVAKKAQAMMAMPTRIEPRHRQELCDAIGRCEVVADPRIARATGAQS